MALTNVIRMCQVTPPLGRVGIWGWGELAHHPKNENLDHLLDILFVKQLNLGTAFLPGREWLFKVNNVDVDDGRRCNFWLYRFPISEGRSGSRVFSSQPQVFFCSVIYVERMDAPFYPPQLAVAGRGEPSLASLHRCRRELEARRWSRYYFILDHQYFQ